MSHQAKAKKTSQPRPKPWQTPTIPPRASPIIPLPTLLLPNQDGNVVEIAVLAKPVIGEGRGLTWIVDERPGKQIGTGEQIRLRVGERRTGVGRMTTIIGMRKHWITWTISGGVNQCAIRVPTPWAALTGTEGAAHTRVYRSLPDIPPHTENSHT